MKQHRVELEDFALSVREVGSGPPVVLAHSLTFDHAMWSRQVAALQDRYRLLLVDLHGHGASAAPDRVFTLEQVADDVARVLDHLDVERAAWVGHSLGGMVGMRFALRHPQRVTALGLLNTSANAEGPMRDHFHDINERSRGKPSNEPTVNFILQLMFSAGFRKAHPEAVEPFREHLFDPPNPEGAYRTGHAVIWRTDVVEALKTVSAPALVIISSDDSATLPDHGERIAETIPGAELLRLEGGHLSPVEQADAVNKALGAFLDQHWSTP